MTFDRAAPRRLSEFAMIAKYFAPLSRKSPGAFGLTDDVALVRVPDGHELVAKVDAIVEGVHFFRDDPPDLVAKKALRVNLSDLAAKGAKPIGYLLSLSLAPWAGDEWIAAFASGLAEDQQQFGLDLLGGDTTSTPSNLTISITALGSIANGTMVRRSGAQPGDLVFVTGTVGDAGGGLSILKGEGVTLSATDRDFLIARYRVPEPRLSLGPKLSGLASSSLDISDGLIADCGHIAETSRVGIRIDAARVPLSPPLVALWGNSPQSIARAATSGDDYEIAFTAPASTRARIAAAAKDAGVPVTEIGTVESGEGVVLRDKNGQAIPLASAGYTHF